MPRLHDIRLILTAGILAILLGVILSSNSGTRTVHAFSSGPPAGFTGAPGEFTCAECHVPPDAGTGKISISAPASYSPGQTYQITVTHQNADTTRRRWGFQMTTLDPTDSKAGEFEATDELTQVLDNQGPGNSRQYIEHKTGGTFVGQTGGASWTFNWTAPAVDVGPITFYAAGNQANNDDNTSGDYIYFTFVSSSPTTGLTVAAAPQSRTVAPGNNTSYELVINPTGGLTGPITLSVSGLPAGVNATFNPANVSFGDSSAVTTVLTLGVGAGTALGNYNLMVKGTASGVTGSTDLVVNVASPQSANLGVTQTVSPNPATVGTNLTYRVLVTNEGPAMASNVTLGDSLPGTVSFVSATASQGSCNGTSTVKCDLGSLAVDATVSVTIVVTPGQAGQLTNAASVTGSQVDPVSGNNSREMTINVQALSSGPVILDPNLTVTTIFNGLNQPTSMAFLGANDLLVLERTTGRVQRIVNGVLQGSVLDLAVNGASERGLLGIALHPDFVVNGFVYLFWTESSTGADTSNIDEVGLLGNRVDRYIWNGSILIFDRNLIRLRALQQDANQPSRGNHNGGVLRFGLDGKLYIFFGDNGRRGFLQNVTNGGMVPDDQFGGPEPDDAHLSGVILRLNDDGSIPADNPFFNINSGLSGQAATNIKKVFAYGLRNSFGMAFDPLVGSLWLQENGDDGFDEINRVLAGMNGGWIQTMGPISRLAEYKQLETTYGSKNLQQLRWPPENIASSQQEMLSRLYSLAGSHYVDPELSWKYAVAPSAIGFIKGRNLGPQLEGDLLVGTSRTTLLNGYLFRLRLENERQHFSFSDPLLVDRVADNVDKFDVKESESLLFGTDFGVTTDIQTGPNGNVYIVSLSNGAIYEIKSKPQSVFVATLNASQVVPATTSTAQGTAVITLSPDETSARLSLALTNLSSHQTAGHIHGPAAVGANAGVVFPLPSGELSDFQIDLSASQVHDLKNGLYYIDLHTTSFMGGEIRGQFQQSLPISVVQFEISSALVGEGGGSVDVPVTRFGDLSSEISVDYATTDGAATEHSDYMTARGTLNFAAGETTKTITVFVNDDSAAEANETFDVELTPNSGVTLGSPKKVAITIVDNDSGLTSSNPIDDARFFVRQHYRDFLNREPDGPGWDHWTAEISRCGDDAECIGHYRDNTSAAFFLSPEFQVTTNFVYRMYKGSLSPGYGLAGRLPTYTEAIKDSHQVASGIVVDHKLAPAAIETNCAAYATAFVQRAEFRAIYDSLTNQQYVDRLFATTGITPTQAERDALINGLAPTGSETRASVLRKVVDGIRITPEGGLEFTTRYGKEFYDKEFDSSFVLMEYFGYLRRDPDSEGYQFWLDKLRRYGNWVSGELVRAFVISPEYRGRFAAP